MADEMIIDAVQSPNRLTAGAPKQLNMKALERIRETGRHAVAMGSTSRSRRRRAFMAVPLPASRQRHDLGLGPFPAVSSPWLGRRSPKSANSFTAMKTRWRSNEPSEPPQRSRSSARRDVRHGAESYIVAHSAGWKNAKSADQWRASLATYAGPRSATRTSPTSTSKTCWRS